MKRGKRGGTDRGREGEDKACIFYQYGVCLKGDDCEREHFKSKVEPERCKSFIVDGTCRFGTACMKVHVRGQPPPIIQGRLRRKEETESTIDAAGWLHTGDVGYIDDDGDVFIVDRIKNLIIRGGLNIAPTEIENVLYRHDAVLEASAVGVPDPEWGEAIVAVVALKDGAEATAEELRTHCRMSELTSIKIPERVEFMDSLPKNAVGKIAKNEIRDRFWGDGRKV